MTMRRRVRLSTLHKNETMRAIRGIARAVLILIFFTVLCYLIIVLTHGDLETWYSLVTPHKRQLTQQPWLKLEAKIITEEYLVMSERTDEQVFLEKPIKVTLGGKKYEIKPKKVGDNLRWREKCGELCAEIVDIFQQESDKNKWLKAIVPILFGKGYDIAIEMMFLYADTLREDEERIRRDSSDEELFGAAMECFEFGFPFVKSLMSSMINLTSKLGTEKIETIVSGL